MSNELQKIVAEIKYRTGETLDQIATTIGYTRPHLNTAVSKGDAVHVKDALLKSYGKKLKDYWTEENNILHEEEPQFERTHHDEKNVDLSSGIRVGVLNNAMLRVLLRSQAEILAKQRGVKLSTVLAELTKAVADETLKGFDEL